MPRWIRKRACGAFSASCAMLACRRNNIINAIIMLANMVSVVGCVVLIKAVYQAPYNFTYANTILTYVSAPLPPTATSSLNPLAFYLQFWSFVLVLSTCNALHVVWA